MVRPLLRSCAAVHWHILSFSAVERFRLDTRIAFEQSSCIRATPTAAIAWFVTCAISVRSCWTWLWACFWIVTHVARGTWVATNGIEIRCVGAARTFRAYCLSTHRVRSDRTTNRRLIRSWTFLSCRAGKVRRSASYCRIVTSRTFAARRESFAWNFAWFALHRCLIPPWTKVTFWT